MSTRYLTVVLVVVALALAGWAATPDLGRATDPLGSPAAAAPAGPADAGPGGAADALAVLAVKGRAPKTGYSRAQFGQAWRDTDRNGCDQRNDVLGRDLDNVQRRGRCIVLSGTLYSAYTGNTVPFRRGRDTSDDVPIDHVVSLSAAWQTGAQQLTATEREQLANDPLNLQAVERPVNQAKGDSDAASWLPPAKAYRCTYVARQIAVKTRYRLWVTQPEHDAMDTILAACPQQSLPAA